MEVRPQDHHGLLPMPRLTHLELVPPVLSGADAGADRLHLHVVNLLNRVSDFELVGPWVHLEAVGPASAGPRSRRIMRHLALVGALLGHQRSSNYVIDIHRNRP